MQERNGTTWALAAALLAAAILSFALVTPWAASAETHAASLAALEENQSTVLELAAASTAASAAITLLPGDAATPIADKLADISGYFLLALCAIYLEKYLLTVTAYAAFRLLVPAACLLLAAWLLAGRDWLRKAGWKLLVFGLAIALVIPASVKVSGLIEDTYRLSMEETLQQAKDTTQAVEDSAQSGDAGTDQGFLGGLFYQAIDPQGQFVEIFGQRVDLLIAVQHGAQAGISLLQAAHLRINLLNGVGDPPGDPDDDDKQQCQQQQEKQQKQQNLPHQVAFHNGGGHGGYKRHIPVSQERGVIHGVSVFRAVVKLLDANGVALILEL